MPNLNFLSFVILLKFLFLSDNDIDKNCKDLHITLAPQLWLKLFKPNLSNWLIKIPLLKFFLVIIFNGLPKTNQYYNFSTKWITTKIVILVNLLFIDYCLFSGISQILYFIEYSEHFITLRMMLKYSLSTIHGR
jgi:hypothetical protein